MSSFAFSIESMHVDFQRSSINDTDSDWLVFTVKTGTQTRSWQGQVGTNIVSGTLLQPSAENPWLVDFGDINIGDNDLVLVSMVMSNLSHTDTRQQEAEAIKIAGAVGSSIKDADLSAVPIIGGIPQVAAVGSFLLGVFGSLGPILSAIGEIFGGTDKPNCNGAVFSQQFIFSGKQLRDLTQNGASTFRDTKLFNDQQSPHECGHNPETHVAFLIVPNPAGFSMKRFLRSRGVDPSKGVRQLTHGAAGLSIKSAISQ